MIPVAFTGKPSSWSCQDFTLNYWYKTIKEIVPIELDKNPKFVFVNCTSDSLRDFYLNWRDKAISIFMGLEAIAPNFNDFDFALGFDPISYSDRYLRLNIAYKYRDYFPGVVDTRSMSMISLQNSRLPRTRFCDFIYSNWDAHPTRDFFYKEINGKQFVHSYGEHLKNSILPESAINLDWKSQSIEIRKLHKFSLCFENTLHIGYTSEKIFSSIIAGSIPIYWGNPKISLDLNQRRLIDVHSFENNLKAIEYVLAAHQNVELYNSMLREPIFTEEQLVDMEEWPSKFKFFIRNIFEDSSQSSRRSIGTLADRNRGRLLPYFYFLPLIELIQLWFRIMKSGRYSLILKKKFSLHQRYLSKTK